MNKFTYHITYIDQDGERVLILSTMDFHAPLLHNDRVSYMDKVLVVTCIYHKESGYPTAKCTLEYS